MPRRSWPNKRGKLKPISTNLALKASVFIDRLRSAADISEVIGPYRADCGAWIRPNPLDGKGQSDMNVAAYRYVLIESDTLPKDEQERFYRRYELPIACLVDSRPARACTPWCTSTRPMNRNTESE